jgi:flagellar hook-associated protein 2
VGSPITFSGFNDIDFNLVLNAIMQQESQPLVALQSRQSQMKSRANTFGDLVAKTTALQTAAEALSNPASIASYKAISSDPTAIAVSSGSSALAGRYEIVVNELARSQVMASSSSAPDPDTTVVADGGSLVIGGHTISVTGAVTLKQLAETINDDTASPVSASVVQAAPGSFRLVLTGKNTGAANAFEVQNSLTGGIGVAFTDTDGDNTSGDDAADNAVVASDASLLVNNIAVISSSNTLDSVIPGTTITLYKKDPATTVVIDVAEDTGSLKTRLENFITAYNEFVKFAGEQTKSATNKDPASIGRDPLLRQMRSMMRTSLNDEYATGGQFTYLSQIGVELTQTGTLQLNEAAFNDAISGGTADVAALLAGTTSTPGALASISTMLEEYTQSNGIILEARDQLTEAADRLNKQIESMEVRLAMRRASLQQEFIAADAAMSRLKSQIGSLASFGANL